MATDNNTIHAKALTQAAETVANALKLASAAKDRIAKAPKAAAPEEVEKAAAVLVETGWLPESRKAEAVASLSDPTTALSAMQNLALKAASALGTRDQRLAAGNVVAKTEHKHASADSDESEADRLYNEKLASYSRIGTLR
jgi:hypothetical protein